MKKNNLPIKILVIDDSETNRYYIKTVFSFAGEDFLCITSEDGYSGLATAREEKPDVIILDIMMPGKDGYQVCRELKEDPVTKEIPVLFMTSLSQIEDKDKGFSVGAVDYIAKPVEASELIARVQTHSNLYRAKKSIEESYENIQKELKTAQALQLEMLPKKNFIKNIFFNWYFRPSMDVSGDIFGAVDTEKDISYFYIIDVSGHGVASAMLSLLVKQSIETAIKDNEIYDIYELVKFLDEKTSEYFSDGGYFTCIIMKMYENTVEFGNFGHRKPIFLKNGKAYIPQGTNLPMGMGYYSEFDNIEKDIYEFAENDIIVVYTDGIVEAENDIREFFSEERMIKIIEENSENNSENIVRKIEENFLKFSSSNDPADDITILVMRKVKK